MPKQPHLNTYLNEWFNFLDMELIELCRQIAKAIALPMEYHIAAVFKDNSSDEIIGWRVLDSNNKPITPILKTESLDDWKRFLIS